MSYCEEILLCKAFPVMEVYTKVGDKLGYDRQITAYIIYVSYIGTVLPNCPRNIPIFPSTMKSKNGRMKKFRAL